jgi:hypothetical protein
MSNSMIRIAPGALISLRPTATPLTFAVRNEASGTTEIAAR